MKAKGDQLTQTMQECIEWMKRHDNQIHRHPGGFWSHPNWKPTESAAHSFGERTVAGLVKRGRVAWVDFKASTLRPGERFPISARLRDLEQIDLLEVAGVDTAAEVQGQSAAAAR